MSPPKKDPTVNEMLRSGFGVGFFRTAILVLVLSMHPIGRQLLGTFGFEFPDQKKLNVAAEQASTVKQDLAGFQTSVNQLQTDFNAIKLNMNNVNNKVDMLDHSFQGFQVDFERFKNKP